jgi:YVTN family beta-propeller protein
VSNVGGEEFCVINTSTNSVTNNLTFLSGLGGVAVNPEGTKVYVANSGGTLFVIDSSTNTVTSTVSVGEEPDGISISPEGTKVYVANTFDGTVSVIDTATNTVTATVSAGNRPAVVAVGPALNTVKDSTFTESTSTESQRVSVWEHLCRRLSVT